ncbi:MAG: ScpA family protein [Bdellovibrionales bacterium]
MLVQLEQFEGPMGLLLYLIRKEEMDIYDIQIHKITAQYLNYIKKLQSFDLEQAGDFVAMAATLIQIKARMLLPTYNEEGEEVETEDPRKPLVEQLIEYQKYQDASQELYKRPLLGRDTWKRGRKENIPQTDGGIELEEKALFSLISSYRSVVKKANRAQHRISAKFQTIASRILEISQFLKPGVRVILKDLIKKEDWTSTKVLITFLSGLELGKLGYVKLFQSEDCGPLYFEAKKDIQGDVVGQVAEYDDGSDSPSTLAEVEEHQQRMELQVEEKAVEIASDEEIETAEAQIGLELMEDLGLSEEAVQSVNQEFESNDSTDGLDIDAINEVASQTLDSGLHLSQDDNLENNIEEDSSSSGESKDLV